MSTLPLSPQQPESVHEATPPDSPHSPGVGRLRSRLPLLKFTQPAIVAFIPHKGPYWSLGPLFDEVIEASEQLQSKGPLFVRYYHDPRKTPPAELHMDVGFFLDHRARLDSRFEVETIPSHEVVAVELPATRGVDLARFGLLFDWVAQNHYEPAGALMEIFVGDPRDRTGTQRVELQLPVRPSTEIPANPSPSTDNEQRNDSEAASLPAPAEVDSGPVIAQALPAETDNRLDSWWRNSRAAISDRTHEDSPGDQPTARKSMVSDKAGSVENRSNIVSSETLRDSARLRQEIEDTWIRSGTLRGSPVAASVPDDRATAKPEPRPTDHPLLKELIESDNYIAVAERVIPDPDEISPALYIWLGHFVYRVEALARGMVERFPEQAPAFRDIADALVVRYQALASTMANGSAAFKQGSNDSTVKAEKMTHTMRELDRLLGRISLKTIDSDAVMVEFIGILSRVEPLRVRE